MTLRFNRRLRIAPGVRLNFSKSGISTSVGTPGATVNLNRNGVQGTAGLPGTGLAYQTDRPNDPDAKTGPPPNKVARFAWTVAAFAALSMIFGKRR